MDQDTEDIIQRGLIRTKHYEFNDHVGPHDRKKFFRDSQDTQEQIDVLLGGSQARSTRRQTVRGRKVIRPLVEELYSDGFQEAGGAVFNDTYTVWADPSNHNTNFGIGAFDWMASLWPVFFHGTAVVGYNDTFTSTITLNLLDASGAVIKYAVSHASFTSTIIGPPPNPFTMSVSMSQWTHDSNGIVPFFNAVQSITVNSVPTLPTPPITDVDCQVWFALVPVYNYTLRS